MATAYSTLLGLALPVTGELSGTWGDTVNNSITSLLDSAVAGTTTLSTDADVTLTNLDGTADTSRQAILLCTGARTAIRTITAPALSKIYTVINSTTGGFSVNIVAAGPTAGVTIVAGESALIAWNGSDFVKVSNTGGSFTTQNLTVTGNTILGDAITDTTTLNAQTRFQSRAILGYANMTGPAATSLTTTAPAFLYSGATTYTVSDVSGGTQAFAPVISLDQATITNATTTTIYTNAATLYIAGAPNRTGLVTFTNSYALYIAAGASYLGGNTAVTGTLSATGNTTIGAGSGSPQLKLSGAASSTANSGAQLAFAAAGTPYAYISNVAWIKGGGSTDNNLAYWTDTGLGHYFYANNNATTAVVSMTSSLLTVTPGATIQGLTVGLGAGAVATNTAVGASALAANTSGGFNTAVGYQAGSSNTTGGAAITAFGYQAGKANTTGFVSAFGFVALAANTTGANNAAFGAVTLAGNTTGSFNTGIGDNAFYSNTTGGNNTAVGYQAGYTNVTGTANTFTGYEAGYTSNATAANGYNTATGYQAGKGLTTGIQNSFFGFGSGQLITSGGKNTIVGAYDGNTGGLDIRTASNYIVLSDGDGNPLIATYPGASVSLNGAVPQTGTGITFPATQLASSNANTLDDYEEGAITGLTDGSGAGLSITFNNAKYTKIGRLVYVSVDTIVYPSTSSTASAVIAGLPFVNTAANVATGALVTVNANANRSLVVSNASTIFFYANGSTGTSTNVQLSATTIYGWSAVYQTS